MRAAGSAGGVAERLDALARAVSLGADVLPADVVEGAHAVEARAGQRLRLSAEHTVVALAGATGSGKSSLLNALAGQSLAEVDVLRPTTSEALAVVRGADGSAPLLDWLGVRRRHTLGAAEGPGAVLRIDGPTGRDGLGGADGTGEAPAIGVGRGLDAAGTPGTGGGLLVGPTTGRGRRRAPDPVGGLILLDLPDHDSVRTEHRLEAERLVRLVDLMVWVLDPQKYADALIHERYLRGLTEHRDVMLVVLNQVDRLSADERAACHRDLARLLAEDGLSGVRLLDVSARTGEGVDGLRAALEDAAARRVAAQARVEADVVGLAGRIVELCTGAGGGRSERSAARSAREELVEALVGAAGVPLVAEAVRAGTLLHARRATGWPVTRWLGRFRVDPLRRLHLGAPDRSGDSRDASDLIRTSVPPAGPAQTARARAAVRGYTDTVTAGAPDPWVLAARRRTEALEASDGLTEALDRAVGGTQVVRSRRPLWWSLVGVLQWVLVLVMVAGLLWLGALLGLDSLRMPSPEPPRVGDWPVPTLAAVGGAVLGLLLAAVGRIAGGVGARRQARRATASLRAAVAAVADDAVVAPVGEVLDRMRGCAAAATEAGGRRQGAR